MKNYLLLGHGDFAEQLMESLGFVTPFVEYLLNLLMYTYLCADKVFQNLQIPYIDTISLQHCPRLQKERKYFLFFSFCCTISLFSNNLNNGTGKTRLEKVAWEKASDVYLFGTKTNASFSIF